MTFVLHVVNWMARKLGIQITLAGRRVGMVDDEFVAIWEKVRARGINRYSIERATVAAVIDRRAVCPRPMVSARRPVSSPDGTMGGQALRLTRSIAEGKSSLIDS